MIWVFVVVAVVALGGAGYGLHRAALWAERRGWIYYKTKQRPPAPWLGTLESIYKPEVEHVIEEASGEAARADQDESGDGPPRTVGEMGTAGPPDGSA